MLHVDNCFNCYIMLTISYGIVNFFIFITGYKCAINVIIWV